MYPEKQEYSQRISNDILMSLFGPVQDLDSLPEDIPFNTQFFSFSCSKLIPLKQIQIVVDQLPELVMAVSCGSITCVAMSLIDSITCKVRLHLKMAFFLHTFYHS
jgi:hypothetical protein